MEDGKTCYLFLSLFLLLTPFASSASDGHAIYIVHMDRSAMPAPYTTPHNWYTSVLSSLSLSDSIGAPPPTHLYTYKYVIDGFSAALSPTHLEKLKKIPGHVAFRPDAFGHLHTTRTPEFLGLRQNAGLWPAAAYGDDTIIGIVDTGIWPESESFRDDGMPPVPARWRGGCETGTEFNSSNCNRKLIGARSFSKAMKRAGFNISKTDDYDSPRDFFGHGTHTSSTAAGVPVPCVNSFGYAKGKAVGMAPKARLAMYKVHLRGDSISATESDTLAGMDQAIADGVDILSLSLGFDGPQFYENSVALGAFAAMERGIFVACSAGNSGQEALYNEAPWITTVGAGSVDRRFTARVTLGDGDLTVIGDSAYPENLLVSRVPLYFGHGNRRKEMCHSGALDPEEVAGKYVFCDFHNNRTLIISDQVKEFERSGAAGAIISSNSGQSLTADEFYLPFVIVKPEDGEVVKSHVLRHRNTAVSVKFQTTMVGTKRAPQVASFSSRGPGIVVPSILKPDILAPGFNVIAAWVPNKMGGFIRDQVLLSDYVIESGTSMSCPHVAGIAALLKAAHRDWSPAAIRSAMMTTADLDDNIGSTILDMATGGTSSPLDFGSGQVNPNKALNPGLVYDLGVQDYINFLCGMNYTSQQIHIITRKSNFSCENASLDINYPSFMAVLNNSTNVTSYSFKRVLTSVDDSSAIYKAELVAPMGMKVAVQPETISFSGKNGKAEFKLTVKIDVGSGSLNDFNGAFGLLRWVEVNGTHVVRSPVVSAFARQARKM